MATKKAPKSAPKDAPRSNDSARKLLSEEAAERAASGRFEGLKLALRVGGGAPSQRLRVRLDLSADGTITAERECELSGEKSGPIRAKLSAERAIELLRRAIDSGLLELEDEGPTFLPGTVVGIVELASADHAARYYFAADEAQARHQRLKLPKKIGALIAELNNLCGRALRGEMERQEGT